MVVCAKSHNQIPDMQADRNVIGKFDELENIFWPENIQA